MNSPSVIAWNGTMWVAGGVYTNKLGYSYDGINWKASTSGNSVFNVNCSALAWNGSLWVAGGTGTNKMAYSSDGINWTATVTTTFGTSCNAVAWNGTIWVAGGQGTSAGIFYSTNGETWENTNVTLTMPVLTLAWNGKIWVAGGPGSGVSMAYSYDGIYWINLPNPYNVQGGPYNSIAARRSINTAASSSYKTLPSNTLSVITANAITSNGNGILLLNNYLGYTYIITSTGSQAHAFYTTSPGVSTGFYINLKNGNATGGGNITIVVNGVLMSATGNSSTGTGIIYPAGATSNGSTAILYYNGTSFRLYN